MSDKSPNGIVKDKDTQVLLDRRAEIREQINKLEAEYQAIGNLLMIRYKYENPKGIQIDIEMKRLQKLKDEEQKFSSGEER